MSRPPSMMSLSIRQLRAFVTIAGLQSFTRAAERLYITQPGLSGMVRDIEQQLDCRLFERTTHAVTLTEHGRAFLPVATHVLAELDKAASSLGQLSTRSQRRLVVGATPVLASSVLPQACLDFAQAHPGVQLQVSDLDKTQMHAGVLDGELDAGFGLFLDAVSGIRRAALFKAELVLVQSAQDRNTGPVHWGEFQPGMPLLALPEKNPVQKLVDSHAKNLVRDAPRQVFHHLHTLLGMVEVGAGCAVLPSTIAAAARRYAVALRPIGRPRVTLEFYQITRSGVPRNTLLTEFSRCLIDVMRQHEPFAQSAG